MKNNSNLNSENIAQNDDMENNTLINDKVSSQAIFEIEQAPKQNESYTKQARGYLKKTLTLISLLKHAVLVLIVIGINSLYPTNTTCPFDNQSDCMDLYLLKRIYGWAVRILLISFVYSALISMTVMGFFYRLSFIILYLGLRSNLISSTMDAYEDYTYALGYWLMKFCFIFSFAILAILALVMISKPFPNLSLLFGLLVPVAIFFNIYYSFVISCDDWQKGLGGEHLINYNDTCRIEMPGTCFFEFAGNIMDMSEFLDHKCERMTFSKTLLQKKFPDSKIIGFPRIENWEFADRTFDKFPATVLKNLVQLDDYADKEADNLEFFLDRTIESQPKIVVEVKRDEELINIRNKHKLQSNPLVKNVLVIYIDALSRKAALRNLPKTMRWFERFVGPEPSFAETFQFFKYHSITPWTFHVLLGMLYGFKLRGYDMFNLQDMPPPNKPYKHIVHDFQENGFITGRTATICHQSGIPTVKEAFKNYIDEQTFDHEGSTFACDPHFHNYERPYNLYQGTGSFMRRCLYGYDAHHYNIEYAKQFWNAYGDENKFLWMHLFDAHEWTENVIKKLDDPLENFLVNLETNNMLDDTIVMLVSDHGLHFYFLDVARDFDATLMERALPALFIMIPRPLANQYRLQLKKNENMLISSLDIYNFFKAISNGRSSTFVNETFFSKIPDSRSCNDINVQSQGCYCNHQK